MSGSFPNRSQWLVPIIAGSAVSIVGSLIPVLQYLNLFMFWFILGGVIAAYTLHKRAPSAGIGEKSMVGALSGLLTSVLLGLLYSLFGLIFWVFMLSEAPSRDEGMVFVMGIVIFVAMWAVFLTIQPLSSALGGLIGGAIWPPDANAAAGGELVPLTPEQLEEKAAKRKKILRTLAGVTGGCFGLMALMGVGFVYLVYLQSIDPRDTAGEEAVLDLPIQTNQTVQFELPDSSGRYGIWLVTEGEISAYSVEGRYDCSAYRDAGAELGEYDGQGLYGSIGDFEQPEWVFIGTEYPYDDLSCALRVTNPELPAGTRLVVTEVINPTDWLD